MTQIPKFRETTFHTTDDKARIVLPARFREVLGASGQEKAVVTRRSEFLMAFSVPEWQVIEDKVMASPVKDAETQWIIRHFIGAAAWCGWDKQGRILVPATLRDFANIGQKQEIAMVGALTHFQIWDKARYTEDEAKYEAGLKEGRLEQRLAELI